MPKQTGLLHAIYESLASIRLTIFIFLALAASSVIGTLLPQGMDAEELSHTYGEGMANLIQKIGANDLYHSWWFMLLLLLLCANLVVCSLERLPKTIKLFQRREEKVDPEKLQKFSLNRQFTTRMPFADVEASLTKTLTSQFSAPRLTSEPGNYGAIAEKGRWSPLMVYVAHISVITVVIGTLVGAIFGFKGFMNIDEGESSKVVVQNGGKTLDLPFEVRCDDFDVSFYDTGAPKEFRSDLTIIKEGKEVHKQTIRVNDPMDFEGITFYQASYGTTLKSAEIELKDLEANKSVEVTLPYRKSSPVPGTQDTIEVVQYQENIAQFGPALGILITRPGQEPKGSWVLVNVPEFHGNKILNYQIRVKKSVQGHYTGLQVKRDPGVLIVWLGFVTLIIGIGMAYYSSHRRVWAWAQPPVKGKSATRVLVAGRSTKHPLIFEREFEALCESVGASINSVENTAEKRK